MSDDNRYSVSYECDNCYYYALVQIPVKTEAPTYYECPHCGITTFRKSRRKSTDWTFIYNSNGETLSIE